MDQDFRPPEYLSFQGNTSENWRRWSQRFNLYLEAKEATGKADSTKIAMLLSSMGPEALERYNQFKWKTDDPGKEDQTKYDDVVKKFQTEFAGLKRKQFSRYLFWEFS